MTVALPYPDGIGCFKREVLKTAHLDATNEKSFCTYMLIDIIQNVAYAGGPKNIYKQPHTPPLHSDPNPRKNFICPLKPNAWGTWFGQHEVMAVTYASKTSPTKRFKCGLNTEKDELRDADRGALKTCFVPLPLATREEKYMHTDLLTPIRVIYLPLKHKVDSTYTDPVCEMSRVEYRPLLRLHSGDFHNDSTQLNRIRVYSELYSK
jgi:hypothetical protein